MKKLLFLLPLALLLCTTPSHALIRAGIKAGAIFANTKLEIPNQATATTQKIKPGFLGGVYGEVAVPLTGFSVRGELLYVQKGFKHEIFNQTFTVNEDELVIAPFLVYNLPVPTIKPFIEAGPEAGFNARDKITGSATDYSAGSNWKNQSLSLNVGAGVNLPLKGHVLTLEGRYNLGLTNMGGIAASTSGSTKAHTNGLQLLVGYSLFDF
ncbi:MAG TPA: porin family protein [bacterium]|jgi:hypothetical protein